MLFVCKALSRLIFLSLSEQNLLTFYSHFIFIQTILGILVQFKPARVVNSSHTHLENLDVTICLLIGIYILEYMKRK